MVQEQAVLRFQVDGRWYVHEWTDMMSVVDDFYSDLALIDLIDELTSGLATKREKFPELEVAISKRIRELKEVVLSDENKSRDLLSSDEFRLEAALEMAKAQPLLLARIHYESPGEFDLLGLGKIANAVQKLFSDIFKYLGDAKKREREGLENLKFAVEISRENGLSEEEIRKMIRHGLRKNGHRVAKYRDSKRLPKPPKLILLPSPEKS